KLDQVLFDHARKGDEGALALLLQIYVGMRSKEVLRLIVDNVEPQHISIKRGKSQNAVRRLEVYKDVAELLWEHVQNRPSTGRFFAASLPRMPVNSWLYKRLQTFCELSGIPRLCPHGLRGLHSSLALQGGATTHAVAASLGHSSFRVTERHY